ncbi:MAG: DNA alkylation repair protein [Acidimicrobiaceae bacterium]|nr:DNA alkylation repair protein [Acidimicrobiaceae bacterium]
MGGTKVANDLGSVMEQLEAAGTAQNRKVYARHGAAEPMFGVSYAALGKIAKPIRTDHALARQLWDTGNHDARVLALRVADPGALDESLARRWLRDIDNYILAEGLGGLCAQTRHARTLSDSWRDDPGEWPASVGWFIVTCSAEDPDVWSLEELEGLLDQIEIEIGERPNRVRHEMNGAMIVMALRDPVLSGSVLAAAERIGPVRVDHGQTGCKTPEVAPYVERTLAHRAAKASRQAVKAKRRSG